MGRLIWKSGTMLYPVPAVMVTCGDMDKSNIITIAWTGIINTDPAMTYISIRKERYSHEIISNTKEFVINLVPRNLVRALDYSGVRTGRKEDKFKKLGLTKEKAENVNVPLIKESPVCLECKVEKVIELGSHDMFIAKIISVDVDEKYLNEDNKFDMRKCDLVAYSHGQYYSLGDQLGKFGFSVEKK